MFRLSRGPYASGSPAHRLDDRGEKGATAHVGLPQALPASFSTIPVARFAKLKAPDFSEAFLYGPRRDRTCDPLIKSQLLYQLS